MRNLKRALSLGLTAAMISGLMVMGSSAVSYPDSDQIQNQTAVEILGEIGVMVGDDNGNFNPTQDVTRAEMAVIITRILYGNDLNVDQFKGMNLFTDVPAWAEGFVNLCASLDIVAGVGDGKFAPNETVTAAQAALMLSRALGYFQNNAEFGNDWALAAIRRATSAGIIGDDMVLAANEGLSRDNVAQMTFNTLTKAVPVQYNELLNVYYNENQGITYALTFNYLQTLGYTNFDLVYDNGDTTIYGRPATTWGIGSYRTTTSDKDSGSRYDEALDANGGLISSNVQILSRDEIITIANEPTYTYTDATAEEDIYDDLGSVICNGDRDKDNDYTWTVYVNGEEVFEGDDNSDAAIRGIYYDPDGNFIPENDDATYQFTGEGAQTEIYVDDGAKTVRVVEINYYLGQVASVHDGDNGQYTTVRTVSELKNAKLDDRTFATTEFAKDNYVVYTIDQNADDDFYICEMTAPETVDGTVTRVNKNNDSDNSYLYLDRETKYDYSDHMAYDLNDENVEQHPSLEEDYTLYLDPNGYVLAYSGDTTKSFLYVQDSDEELADWEARVVLADGTDDVVMVDDELDNGKKAAVQYGKADDIDWADNEDDLKKYETWLDSSELAKWDDVRTKVSDIDYQIWEYETNADGDLYTLTGRNTRYAADVKINNGEAYIENSWNHDDILIDNSTIFVDVENNTTYTGYEAVPDVSNAYIAYVLKDDENRDVAEIVYIIKGEIYDADAIYFVLTSSDRDTEKYDGDYYFEFDDMYVDGHRQSGLYVSYDALIEAGITSLDEDDADADRDRNTDAEIDDVMVGEVYKVLKSEDGTYITKIQHVDSWRWAETASSSALWVYYTGLNGTDKYKTNADTTYVVVEATYDRHGEFDGWDVSEGGYGDIIEWADRNDKDNDGYITLVQVVKADDGTAELVYILKYIPATIYDVLFYGNHDAFTWSGAEQYEEGSDYTGTITAAEGYDISNVTVTEGAEYVTLTKVDENTWNVAIADIAADVAIQVDVKAEVDMRTLRLEGNLADAAVYVENGVLKADRTGMAGFVAYAEYDIPVSTEIQIRDEDIDVTGTVMVGTNVGTASNNVIQVTLYENATLRSVNSSVVSIEDGKGNVLANGTLTGKNVVFTVPKEDNAGSGFMYEGKYYAYGTEVNLSVAENTTSIDVTPGYIVVSIEGDAAVQYQTANEAHYSALAGTGTGYMLSKDGGETWTYVAGNTLAAEDATTDLMIKKGYIEVDVTVDPDEANLITEIVDGKQWIPVSEDSVTVTIKTGVVSNGSYTLTYKNESGTDFDIGDSDPDIITTSVGPIEEQVTISFTAGTTDRDFSLKLV